MILTKPVGLQKKSILDSDARINIWDGAVRSGKTVASILRWLHFIATGPPGELLMAGRTERTLKRNVLDLISDMVGEDDFSLRVGVGEARIFGRRIYLAGANDERSETKLRGLTLAGAYGDEITTWAPNFWGMLLSRLSVTGAKAFCTTNPDNPNHWLKRDYLDRPELDLKRFRFTIDDNPNLDPGYVDSLKAEYQGVWYRRYIQGEWVQAEGAIYEWSGRYVVQNLPAEMRWICVAMDYGRVNPFIALLIGLGGDGRVYVASELRWDSRKERRQKSDAEYSQDLQKWLRSHGEGIQPEYMICDPSAHSFMAQLWRDGLESVRPGDNAVDDGIRVVATAMSQDRLRVHYSCKGLLDEFPSYAWDAQAAEKRGEDRPLKRNDHALDALRYGLMGTRHIWSRAELRQPDF